MRKVVINENTIRKMVSETISRLLKESDYNVDTDDDYDDDYDVAEKVCNEIQNFLDENNVDAWVSVVNGYESPEIRIKYTYVISSYADGPGVDNSDMVKRLIPKIENIFDCSVYGPSTYYNGNGDYSYENTFSYVWTLDVNYESWRCRRDKDYAMKYGYPKKSKKRVQSEMDDMWSLRNADNYAWNNNVKTPRGRLIKQCEELGAWQHHYCPNLFKPDGSYVHDDLNKRKDEKNKEFYGTDQYYKRPLHRKGSLNREL